MLLGLVLGFGGQFGIAAAADAPNISLLVLMCLAALGGTALFIWGCAMHAKAKGHSPWLGLLGLLGCIGLIVLVVIPDTYRIDAASGSEGPPPPGG
ncbi:MAG: hypothetical protein HYR64_04625 [Fimbriimonas ginsengisoli]|uniref:Uncharacterized protein n=1 Tax=Fimbriimonas ginsengisoli TaxID=1005039 RepID=A0A931PW82_FIMGI|nr:hypothetical protein [Fimbriimonas ginsengisoli]